MSFCFQDILWTQEVLRMLEESEERLSVVNAPVSEPYSLFKKNGW